MKYKFKNESIKAIVEHFANEFGVDDSAIELSAKVSINCDTSFTLCSQNTEGFLTLPAGCVEKVNEYDPKKWNKYPEVTPPIGVPMRVQVLSDDLREYTCAVFADSEQDDCGLRWRYVFNGVADDPIYAETLLFRPWED